jgi:hypothetical protein
MRRFLAVLLSISLGTLPLPAYGGQYSQKCQQAGQDAQSQCGGATAGANAGDMGQAGGLMGSVGASASVNPGAGGLMSQALGQIGRLSQASGQCEQAKQQCEQQCDQQKQAAQGDQKAQQQGEPGQVDQSKQSSCSSPMDSMIGPLLAALAAALAALAAAQKSKDQSQATHPATPGTPTTTTTLANADGTTNQATNPAFGQGDAGFLKMKGVDRAISAFQAAGGDVTANGVRMPDGSFSSWNAINSGTAGGAFQTRPPAGLDGGRTQSIAGGTPAAGPAMATTEGSGSGSSAVSTYTPYRRTLFGDKNQAKIAAGKTINLSGTPIGTKADDIFEMVHRSYTRKRDLKLFEEGLTAPPSGRMPASVSKPAPLH